MIFIQCFHCNLYVLVCEGNLPFTIAQMKHQQKGKK